MSEGGSYPSDAWLASKARAPSWSGVAPQRGWCTARAQARGANKRKGCHREREPPSNRRSLPTCAGQPVALPICCTAAAATHMEQASVQRPISSCGRRSARATTGVEKEGASSSKF